MLAAVATVVAVLGLGFFGVLGLVDPAALATGGNTEAARTFASYMSTRNLAMGGAALLLLALRAWRGLSLVLVLNAVVQALDARVGTPGRRRDGRSGGDRGGVVRRIGGDPAQRELPTAGRAGPHHPRSRRVDMNATRRTFSSLLARRARPSSPRRRS